MALLVNIYETSLPQRPEGELSVSELDYITKTMDKSVIQAIKHKQPVNMNKLFIGWNGPTSKKLGKVFIRVSDLNTFVKYVNNETTIADILPSLDGFLYVSGSSFWRPM